ncbi:MAG: glucosyl-3-phosphoglycerate phosphatase [Cryptosporangiaceae bacterium]|nr:glucosyl-3-phosphoglycerate phosphatase [Cryptosporangiaceae bacterium]
MSGRRLLLWRHGRTEWNAAGRMQGQSDVALDDTGRAQAREAAPLLAAEQPDAIVSSDLVRAHDTALVLAALTGLPVRTDPRLRESNFGPWQGLTSEEIAERFPEPHALWRQGKAFTVPGAETPDEVAARMLAGIEDALDATDGTLVVAAHGAAARHAVRALLGWPYEVAGKIGPLGNCRWTELRHTATGWRLHAHNAGPVGGPAVPVASADVEPPSAGRLTPAPAHH